jgi:hypothetical protein
VQGLGEHPGVHPVPDQQHAQGGLAEAGGRGELGRRGQVDVRPDHHQVVGVVGEVAAQVGEVFHGVGATDGAAQHVDAGPVVAHENRHGVVPGVSKRRLLVVPGDGASTGSPVSRTG